MLRGRLRLKSEGIVGGVAAICRWLAASFRAKMEGEKRRRSLGVS
jgi:hypothetical protein